MSLNSDFYHYFQGFFYLSIPLLLFLIGYQLSKIFNLNQFLLFLVWAGNIISLVFIVLTVYHRGFTVFLSPYTEARNIVGSGSPACVLSFIIALYSRRFGINLFKRKINLIITILINISAIYLFGSRTYLVMLFVFILLFSLKTIKSKNIIPLFFLFLVSIFITLSITYSRKNLSYANSIVYKLIHSIDELKMSEYKTYREINLRYRGYESYRTWETYKGGSKLEILFGHGFGKLVDLKVKIFLGQKFWTEIPIIHNGFFFILLRFGLFGVVFFLLLFYLIAIIGYKGYISCEPIKQFKGVLMLSCGLSLFFTNWIVGGLFNLEMSILTITTGYLMVSIFYEFTTEKTIVN